MTAAVWSWVAETVVVAIHDRQLAEHGGSEGLGDPGLLASALARPRNAAAYGTPDAAGLAASYAYGLANNHPFIDGNKRTAWVVARLFLAANGRKLTFSPADAVATIEALAAGVMGERQLADWFRSRIAP